MLTRSAAQELAPYDIKVNAVSPGLIARPGIEDHWPEGVARWITGQNLVLDGGVLSSMIY